MSPELGDRAADRSAADQAGIGPALGAFAVTHDAFLREAVRPLRGRAAAGREARAVRLDADIPARDIGFRYRLPEPGSVGGESGACAESERNGKSERLKHRHVSPPRSC